MASDRFVLYVGGLACLVLLAALRLLLPASPAVMSNDAQTRPGQTQPEGALDIIPPMQTDLRGWLPTDLEPIPDVEEEWLGDMGAFRRGMVFGLFPFADEAPRYRQEFHELSLLGVNALSINFNWYMDTVRDATVFQGEADPNNQTPSDATLRQAVRDAHDAGLHVMLFPSIYIMNLARREWRGRIAPPDWDVWFASYRALIVHLARLAAEEDVEELCIGVELISTENQVAQWERIIREVRDIYDGRILYSSNWDARGTQSWLALTDMLAMNAYYDLTDDRSASVEDMVAHWRGIRDEIAPWREHFNLPLVITEIGYRSADGSATAPWNYYLAGDLDLEEQRRCYEAFFRAWFEDDLFEGVYWYNWFGEGGPTDRSYTPRGKPAGLTMREWYRQYALRDAARSAAARELASEEEAPE